MRSFLLGLAISIVSIMWGVFLGYIIGDGEEEAKTEVAKTAVPSFQTMYGWTESTGNYNRIRVKEENGSYCVVCCEEEKK